jgi:hypothetical protein
VPPLLPIAGWAGCPGKCWLSWSPSWARAGKRVRTHGWPIGRVGGWSEAPGTGWCFVDRLLATLVYLRHGVTHDVLACRFGVSRSTITRAVGEVRPLLAEPGCTVEGGVRLRTLADVVAHLGASRQVGLLDATEVTASSSIMSMSFGTTSRPGDCRKAEF